MLGIYGLEVSQDHLNKPHWGLLVTGMMAQRVCDVLFHSVGSGNNVTRNGNRSMGKLIVKSGWGWADDHAAVPGDYVRMRGPWRDQYLDKG